MSKPIVLVGLPGAGKTTVGHELAALLDLPFRDTDDDIARTAGTSVSDIFVNHGEDHFRELERKAVAAAIAEHDGVISLGGGAVSSPQVRELLSGQTVIHLQVAITEALRRAELDAPRPLLAINPRATLRSLAEQRLPWYAEVAEHEIDTTGSSPAQLARTIAGLTRWSAVEVPDAARPYSVTIGPGTATLVDEVLPDAEKIAFIYSPTVEPQVRDILAALPQGRRIVTLEIPDAEAGKELDVVGQCWEALGEEGFTRTDAVVSVGGGAVSDVAGFVAATWLRGVDVVHLPTSLLGAVDAAVGGKTGINTAAGKNLVGAFHPPKAVLCDTRMLRTLPREEMSNGLAEIIKAGFICDTTILDLIEHDPAGALDPNGSLVPELMRRAIAVKADIVGEDLTEQGKRVWLNFGHTLAHAIEKQERYRLRHGFAVAIGMVYAAELGALTERVNVTRRLRRILESVGLPTSYSGSDWDSLRHAMVVDKKNRGSTQRFVLLDDIAQPAAVSDVPASLQAEAFGKVSS
ncbi:3-dehydroquinate synthase [Haloglycomyces albus]|uniref:3-dehydroquinate synthase n=1 Tax=Haloglycomyces albus TaxID=526067 RepID=UPI00046D31F1|nr:3-dehydroquinate synthase [Haloglycomyces albus]